MSAMTITKRTVDLSGMGGGYEAMCQTMLWRGVAWLAETKPEFEKVWPPLKLGEHRREDTPLAKELDRAILFPGEDATGAMFGAAMSHIAYIARHGVDKWLADVEAKEPWRIYVATVDLGPHLAERSGARPRGGVRG